METTDQAWKVCKETKSQAWKVCDETVNRTFWDLFADAANRDEAWRQK